MLPSPEPDPWATLMGQLPPGFDLVASGILSGATPDGRPGAVFPWTNVAGATVYQIKPHTPRADPKTGKPVKYEWQPGVQVPVHVQRDVPGSARPILLVEGTKQRYWADAYAPQDFAVYAIAGCWMWKDDLSFAEGRDVHILMDADWRTNRDVFDAVKGLREQLDLMGAESVRMVTIPSGRTDKTGLDDILSALPEDKRASSLLRWIEKAADSLGKAPARKAGNPYFNQQGGLLAQSASRAVLEGQPAALAKGSMVALYRDGVFRIDRGKEPLFMAVQEILGEEYRPNWRATIEESLIGILARDGLRLPERMDRPLLNCSNGMLNLETGELLEHDPAYLSTRQIPVAWDPDAKAPNYEQWLAQVCPDQADDLEEAISTMLDPSRTPHKAVFLFGPSRSGKSTYLRLAESIAGTDNVSGVDLHQLSENRFAAANLYQRMLNSSADLSSEHVQDLSLFKRMTGEDVILADRKYGDQFSFTNTALFAFSANELPTVSESSRAYVERIKPFSFPYSFAGREDQRVEDAVRSELPGILVRWVAAWQRYHARGAYQATAPAVLQEFETKSDRVAMWLHKRGDVHAEAAGRLVDADQGSQKKALYGAFKAWLTEEGSAAPMRFGSFVERLSNIPGVGECRLRHLNKAVGLNITVHNREQTDFTVRVGGSLPNPRTPDTAPNGMGGDNPFSAIFDR